MSLKAWDYSSPPPGTLMRLPEASCHGPATEPCIIRAAAAAVLVLDAELEGHLPLTLSHGRGGPQVPAWLHSILSLEKSPEPPLMSQSCQTALTLQTCWTVLLRLLCRDTLFSPPPPPSQHRTLHTYPASGLVQGNYTVCSRS